MNIKVSVISLAFRPGFIDTVVDSLIHQTLPQDDWELIIVDDSYEIRKEAVADYLSGRVKNWLHIPPLHIEKGVAPALAINAGLIRAKGELVYFMSDRFYANPRCLERHWEIYSKYGPNVVISGPFIDADIDYREDHSEFSDKNAISILEGHIEDCLIPVWPDSYPADWRIISCRSIQIDTNLYENRNNAGHGSPGCWWWCGINDSAPTQALVAINGLDEGFDKRRGGADTDCGSRLASYGCRYLIDTEAPCLRLPGTIRKPNTISEEDRIRRLWERREGQRVVFAPNDYKLREEREKIGLITREPRTFDTSVITIHAGHPDLLKKCVDNIKENTTIPYRHVIVVDKPNTEAVEYLESLSKEGAKIAINPEIVGIERAMNQVFQMAEGKYICSINTDVIISLSAIEAMRLALEMNPRFGWVALSSEYTAFFPGCSMFTREAFDEVGLLDERYFGSFSDDDYMRRMWKAGYKPHIVSGVKVSHKHSGATMKALYTKEEITKRSLTSQAIFHEKWGERGTNWDSFPVYSPHPHKGLYHKEGDQLVMNTADNIHRNAWIRSKATLEDTILEVACAENPVWAKTSFKVTTLDKSAGSEQQCFPDVVGEAENLPFECQKFDIVCLGELLEHVPDPQKVLKEAIRVARKKVVVTVPEEHMWPPELKPFENTSHIRFYTPDTFNEELTKAGLPYRIEVIKCEGWTWLGAEIFCNGRETMANPKKLNIGSFTVMLGPPEEWLNIDIIDLTTYANEMGFSFQQVDVTKGLLFDDNSIDFINSSHLIEHLTVEEGIAFLKEARRVLSPNSVVRIGTPDVNKFIDAYKGNEMDKFSHIQPEEYAQAPSQADKFWRILTAGHKTCYDFPALQHSFELAGFEGIRQVEYNENLDMYPEVSLYVEAKKGGEVEIPSPQVEAIPEYWQRFAARDRM